jgi:hypothetical protein
MSTFLPISTPRLAFTAYLAASRNHFTYIAYFTEGSNPNQSKRPKVAEGKFLTVKASTIGVLGDEELSHPDHSGSIGVQGDGLDRIMLT